MNLLTIEKDLVARLAAQINSIEIRSFPDNPEQYFRTLRSNGAILVRYDSSDYEIPIVNKNETRIQQRTARWIIVIVYRGLVYHNNPSGDEGVYMRMQDVRQALTGYTPGTQSGSAISDSTIMYPIRDQFLDNVGNLWFYEMTFEHALEETPNR